MKPIALTVALIATLQVQSQSAPIKPHATLRGNVVRVVPSNYTFSVPAAWVKWNRQYGTSLQTYGTSFHLTRQQIEKAEKATGEWSRPASGIVNAIFPIARCGAHIGSEGWGRDAVGSSVQMRIYTGKGGVANVDTAVKTLGVPAAKTFSKKVALSHSRAGAWKISNLSYYLDYGDYGGTARFDVYARTFGSETVVLVFMYIDVSDRKEIASIIKSFKAPN